MGLNCLQQAEFMYPMVPIVQEVGMRGLYLDQVRRAKMGREIEERIAALDTPLHSARLTNPQSPAALARDLMRLGVPLTKLTAGGGQFQTDLEVLGWANFRHGKKFPFLATLIERSKLAKAGRNLRGLRICDDGLLRTRLNALGTRTLRYSSGGWGRKGKPGYCPSCERWTENGHGSNLQNIPRDNRELGVNVKEVLGARPGWLLGELDYSALELHIQAYRIGSEKLISRIEAPNSDMHSLHAKLQWPEFVKKSPAGERQRSTMKNVIYGLRGGGGDRALQIACAKKDEFISLPDLATFRKTIFSEYPEMEDWIDETQLVIDAVFLAGERRICRNAFEWPRVLFGHQDDALKEWLATEISGTAAGGLNFVLWRLANEHPEAFQYVNLQVHDSLLVHAPVNVFPEVMHTVYTEMRRPWWIWGNAVSFGVECKAGERWSGMVSWDGAA